jgi:hypothetical protein
MFGRGGGWVDAVMDAGMGNRGLFPVKVPTPQPDSCASRLHARTNISVPSVVILVYSK